MGLSVHAHASSRNKMVTSVVVTPGVTTFSLNASSISAQVISCKSR